MTEKYKGRDPDHLKLRLSGIVDILAKAAAGDFSGLEQLTTREEEEEFTELLAKIKLILEVTKGQLGELKHLNDSLEKKIEQRTAELIAKNHQLRNQTQLYETLLNAQSEMGEGVAITEGPRFVYVNDALCSIYGYSRSELMNMLSYFELVAPDVQAELKDRHRQRIAGSRLSDSGETQIIRKDGARIFIEYSLKPVHVDGKDQLITIIHDVTHKKQTEEIIRKERERSEKAELSRAISEKFLANISHEIRTPMNAIVGFAKLLADLSLNDEQKKYSEIIRRSGENLLVIINDILDLSRLREGKIVLESTTFSVPELVTTSLQVVSASAEKKNIALRSLIDPRLNINLLGDPVRLGQILLNLLSNAVKFTDSGEIAVSCALLAEQKNDVEVGFTISDTGRGIAMEELPYIFDRFGKAQQANWKQHEGTGIGLAISRHLVELMGGEITLTSTLNEGTSFHYTLSFRKSNAPYVKSRPAEGSSYPHEIIASTPARILLVEDNEMNRELIRILCQRWNYDLEMAEDGKIALEKLKVTDYSLILMDIKLPGMSGYEVTERLRRIRRSRHTPVIAVTAHAIEGEKEKCIAAGMNDYVSKPIDASLLHSKIEALLKRRESDRSEKKKNKVIDLDYLRSVTMGNSGQQARIIRLFITQAPVMIDEMKRLLKTKKLEELASLAHKYKSGSGNVLSAESMRAIAGFENNCRNGDAKSLSGELKKLEQLTGTAIAELESELKK